MTKTLLDLTAQGDVGTITDESKLASVQLMKPQQLYELWEQQNWVSQTIDLDQGQGGLGRLHPRSASNMAWNLRRSSSAKSGSTTQFTGLVVAYEDQSEEAFLTTQQVDEARHAQHFNRFYEQVVGYDGDVRQAPGARPRGPQRGLPRSSSTSTWSMRASGSSTIRATSRPRSTS